MQFVPLERRHVSLNLEVHCFPRCTVGIRLFSSVGGIFSWLIQSMGLEPRLWELVDFLCKWRTTYLCFPKLWNVISSLYYQNLVLHDNLTLLCIYILGECHNYAIDHTSVGCGIFLNCSQVKCSASWPRSSKDFRLLRDCQTSELLHVKGITWRIQSWWCTLKWNKDAETTLPFL